MLWDHWDGTNEAYWLVSVSDDADPMGTWCTGTVGTIEGDLSRQEYTCTL